MFRDITGDATKIVVPRTIIAHSCNNKGGWGKGFVLALDRLSLKPQSAYREMAQRGTLVLGSVQMVQIQDSCWVANMVLQDGYMDARNPRPFKMSALQDALFRLVIEARKCKASRIQMPRIGSGYGGGNWPDIWQAIKNGLSDLDIDVFAMTPPPKP